MKKMFESNIENGTINFKINSKHLYKLLIGFFTLGVLMGFLILATITLIMDNMSLQNKLIDYMDKYNSTKDELQLKEEDLNNTKEEISKLVRQNTMLSDEKTVMSSELDIFRKREELFNKYEYVILDTKGKRTDITYEQVKFGEDEMIKRKINPHLLFGIIDLESGGTIKAKNSKSSASGLCQFIRGTGRWVYEDLLGKGKGTYNHKIMAMNAETNIEMGSEYISYLMNKYKGSIMKSMLEYNGGELGKSYYYRIDRNLKRYGVSLATIEREYKLNLGV